MHVENIHFQLFMQIQMFTLKSYTDLQFLHFQNEKYKNL